MSRTNVSMFAASESHDQHGRHAYICKTFMNLLTSELISTKLGLQHWGLRPIVACSNDDTRLTFDIFYSKVNCGLMCVYTENIGRELFNEEQTYRKCPQ